MSNITKDQRGFSIVELLVTLIVIGVVFGAFMTTFTSIQSINKKSINLNTANTIAFAKMQHYENTAFTNLPNTTPQNTLQQVEDFSSSLPSSLGSPRSATVHINSISPSLKQVVVNVQYGSGGAQQTVQYANFIQKNGIGR